MDNLAERVAACRIGSCKRHQNCMYHPCRASIPTQPEAAPVAWMYMCGENCHVFLARKGNINGIPIEHWAETPLYAHPPADKLAAKDAEIERLTQAWEIQHKEKMKERDEAKLWFEKAQEWRQCLDALQAKSDRTMTDHGRLLWRDDVEGVCHSPDLCFEHSDTVRCGPCAIKQAESCGVTTADNLPNLPEVSRLNRKLAALQAHADAMAGYAAHHMHCGLWDLPKPQNRCTCGRTEALRAYEAFKAGEEPQP